MARIDEIKARLEARIALREDYDHLTKTELLDAGLWHLYLDADRAGGSGPSDTDLAVLLGEIERLTRENDEARDAYEWAGGGGRG